MKNKLILVIMFLSALITIFPETENYSHKLKDNSHKIIQKLYSFYSTGMPTVAIIPAKDYSSDEYELYDLLEKEIQADLIDAEITLISPSRCTVLIEELKFHFPVLQTAVLP